MAEPITAEEAYEAHRATLPQENGARPWADTSWALREHWRHVVRIRAAQARLDASQPCSVAPMVSDALDHLGLVLSLLADLVPDERCDGLKEAQAFYNAARPDARIVATPGWTTRLVHEDAMSRATGSCPG